MKKRSFFLVFIVGRVAETVFTFSGQRKIHGSEHKDNKIPRGLLQSIRAREKVKFIKTNEIIE